MEILLSYVRYAGRDEYMTSLPYTRLEAPELISLKKSESLLLDFTVLQGFSESTNRIVALNSILREASFLVSLDPLHAPDRSSVEPRIRLMGYNGQMF